MSGPSWDDFFEAPTNLELEVGLASPDVDTMEVELEMVQGSACPECAGCLYNGFIDEFKIGALRCHNCGHLVCALSPYRVPVL